ncbi:hypothetical protein ACNRWW_02405 [Metabacillus sp. HB246100]
MGNFNRLKFVSKIVSPSLLVLTFLCVSFLAMPIIGMAESNQEQEPMEEIKESKKFRKEFGLNSDISHINDVISLKEVPESKESYGVWLTQDEFSELKNRFEKQEKAVPEIINYIKQSIPEEEFGGLYVDQSDKGVVTITFTKDLKNYMKEMKEIKKYIKMIIK